MTPIHPSGGLDDSAPRHSSRQHIALRVLNAETGKGIPSVHVDLFRDEQRVATARSDNEGRAVFAPLEPGVYQVAQTSFRKDMTGISAKPLIRVEDNGHVYLGRERITEVRFLNFFLRK